MEFSLNVHARDFKKNIFLHNQASYTLHSAWLCINKFVILTHSLYILVDIASHRMKSKARVSYSLSGQCSIGNVELSLLEEQTKRNAETEEM